MKSELIGITVVQDKKINCGDCGKNLVEVVVTETNEHRENRGVKHQKTQFQVVDCPFCKGSSFPSEVFEGSVTVGTLSDQHQLDTVDSDVLTDGTILSVLKVRKA